MSQDGYNLCEINGRTNTHDHPKTTIVFMAGFAGAGKTTLATQLYKMLKWDLLVKDHMKRERLRKYSNEQLNNPQEVEKAGFEAFNDLFRAVEDRVKEGCSLIVDSCGYPQFILEHIYDIIQKQQGKAQLKVVLCRASKERREQRIKQRGSEFWPYLTELPEILADELEEKTFAYLPRENMVELDTNTDAKFEDNLKRVLHYLKVQEFAQT